MVLRRIIFSDENMAEILVNGDEKRSKVVALNLVIKNNLLFSEFVDEVYLAKLEIKEKIITKADIVDFFEKKKKQSFVVDRWKPYIFKKLGQVYINILYSAGLVDGILDRKRLSITGVDDFIELTE